MGRVNLRFKSLEQLTYSVQPEFISSAGQHLPLLNSVVLDVKGKAEASDEARLEQACSQQC